MSQFEVLDTRLASGVWEVAIKNALSADMPDLIVQADGETMEPPRLEWVSEVGAWGVTIEVPQALLSEGVHSVSLIDRSTGDIITILPVICGTCLTEDDRAELARLRGEVDLLKHVIRSQFRSELNAFKEHLPAGTRITYADGYEEEVSSKETQ